jgi:hypothetical protein
MMKHPNKFYGFLTLIFPLMLSGCGTFDVLSSADKKIKDHHIYERQGIDILVESSSLKTTVIKDKDSFERICRSPNPDFASGETSGVSVGLAKGPTIGTSSGAMIDSLGGRSPAVLITRELMYRACELTLNLQATPDLSKEIYWRFLSTVELAIKSQIGAGAQSSSVTSNSNAPLTMAPSNVNALGISGNGNSPPYGDNSANPNPVYSGPPFPTNTPDATFPGGNVPIPTLNSPNMPGAGPLQAPR